MVLRVFLFGPEPWRETSPRATRSRQTRRRFMARKRRVDEPAAEDDEDDDEIMEVDNEDEGDKVLDGDDYVGERVAAFREGSIRKGTVTECGKDEETGVIGWNIEFDDEDVVEYKDGDRGKDENFSLEELQEGIQLYEEEGFNETDN